jgi:hypothetical protein
MYPGVSPYAYTLQNPVRYTDPTGMFVEGANGCGCPPDCPEGVNPPPEVVQVKSYLDNNPLVKMYSSLSKVFESYKKDIPDTEADFTIYGAQKAGDNGASIGVNNEKGAKHSINVDAESSWLKIAEYAGKGWRMILGLDEEIDGREVTRDDSKKSDTHVLIKYSSNSDADNVIWKDGAKSLEEARKIFTETMEKAKNKDERTLSTYSTDSIKIIEKKNK